MIFWGNINTGEKIMSANQRTDKHKYNHLTATRCLKITEKVSFNIASEASYVYILSGQKLIKNAKIQKRHFE